MWQYWGLNAGQGLFPLGYMHFKSSLTQLSCTLWGRFKHRELPESHTVTKGSASGLCVMLTELEGGSGGTWNRCSTEGIGMLTTWDMILPKFKEWCGFKNLYLPPATVMFNWLRAQGRQLVPTILAPGRQKPEDCHRFKVHIVRPIPVRARLSGKNKTEIRAEV